MRRLSVIDKVLRYGLNDVIILSQDAIVSPYIARSVGWSEKQALGGGSYATQLRRLYPSSIRIPPSVLNWSKMENDKQIRNLKADQKFMLGYLRSWIERLEHSSVVDPETADPKIRELYDLAKQQSEIVLVSRAPCTIPSGTHNPLVVKPQLCPDPTPTTQTENSEAIEKASTTEEIYKNLDVFSGDDSMTNTPSTDTVPTTHSTTNVAGPPATTNDRPIDTVESHSSPLTHSSDTIDRPVAGAGSGSQIGASGRDITMQEIDKNLDVLSDSMSKASSTQGTVPTSQLSGSPAKGTSVCGAMQSMAVDHGNSYHAPTYHSSHQDSDSCSPNQSQIADSSSSESELLSARETLSEVSPTSPSWKVFIVSVTKHDRHVTTKDEFRQFEQLLTDDQLAYNVIQMVHERLLVDNELEWRRVLKCVLLLIQAARKGSDVILEGLRVSVNQIKSSMVGYTTSEGVEESNKVRHSFQQLEKTVNDRVSVEKQNDTTANSGEGPKEHLQGEPAEKTLSKRPSSTAPSKSDIETFSSKRSANSSAKKDSHHKITEGSTPPSQ